MTGDEGSVSGSSAGFTVNPTTARAFARWPRVANVGSAFSETLTAQGRIRQHGDQLHGRQTIGFSGLQQPNRPRPNTPLGDNSPRGVGRHRRHAVPRRLRRSKTATQTHSASPSFSVGAASAAHSRRRRPHADRRNHFSETLTGDRPLRQQGKQLLRSKDDRVQPGRRRAQAGKPRNTRFRSPSTPGNATLGITIYDAGSMAITRKEGSVTGSIRRTSRSTGEHESKSLPVSTPAADPRHGVSRWRSPRRTPTATPRRATPARDADVRRPIE